MGIGYKLWLMESAGLDGSFLRCDKYSCINSINFHSLPQSMRNWSHNPKSNTIFLNVKKVALMNT